MQLNKIHNGVTIIIITSIFQVNLG